MRKGIVASVASALLGLATAASAQSLGPAQVNVQTALDRIGKIDSQLHAVIAVDPTAMTA